jgi:hypothetical protein
LRLSHFKKFLEEEADQAREGGKEEREIKTSSKAKRK